MIRIRQLLVVVLAAISLVALTACGVAGEVAVAASPDPLKS